ncbi:thiamine pyrophosphate-requiring protein [Alkalilacustris brevis]|uniref:thiamine pyrophosphate-requiring protein n=1 Tax=Alkalilacustris brevis TaxID=2026338 RepID=UPI001EE45432|nr:thiamine pyrophosphate-requiring protein [Alkalilacustris brevis]
MINRDSDEGASRAEASESRNPTGAEALLGSLKRNGIDYVFSNAGTDFPPIIEAIATLEADQRPEMVLVPHETAGVAMAHGHYLVTGRAQGVMVHVNVGLANCAMGIINAASDDIPVVMMSGRTPITERGRPGGRMTPIQYGQEMYDQTSLVRDVTKFNYEMRYPEQGESLPTRAVALANSAPCGPVYLSLPREPLMEQIPAGLEEATPQQPSSLPHPDPAAIGQLAAWLAQAANPLILCQRSDTEGRAASALAVLSERHGIAVAEPFLVRNVLPGDHPMLIGNDPKAAIANADLVIVLDSGVPWIEAAHRPGSGTRVVHIGPDPQFRRMPVRGYRTDLAIQADPAAALHALAAALGAPDEAVEKRRRAIAAQSAERRAKADEVAQSGATSPMSGEWLSKCVSDIMDQDAVAFSELGLVPGAMSAKGPNRIFNNPHSGGLGWGFPAALGAQLADRDRLVIACIGDGSYMFANPVACHQIAEALELPVLVIIKNNGIWNAVRRAVIGSYPDGAAARANTVPLTSLQPAPDYLMVAAASRAHTERVLDGADLPGALARAVEVIRSERRQAVLDVAVALSDRH